MIGYSLGTFVTIRYLVPPTTEIKVGKLKLKGDNSQLTPTFHIKPGEDPYYEGSPLSNRQARTIRRNNKKDIREQERAIKKETRKRKRNKGRGANVNNSIDK